MTTTITELSALLERVEGAECKLHNDDVGRLICLQEGVEFGRSRIGTGDDGSDELSVYAKGSECSIYSEYRRLCLDCSIDAAVEFFKAVLSGWSIQVSINSDGERRVRLLPPRSSFVDMLESTDIDVSLSDTCLAIIALIDKPGGAV